MKKNFSQIAQDYIDGHPLTGFEYRTVLRWFHGPSLYFPTDQMKKQALDAFIWLYQSISADESIRFDREARNKCCARFSDLISSSAEAAECLVNDFLKNLDSKKPIIIGIEGLDGSGKAVQANELYAKLKRAGKRVCVVDFPQYEGFFGREIGGLLSGANNVSAMELDEKSTCLWYALDRWKTIGGMEMDRYEYVIFNRYTLSNVVYQSARKYGCLNREFADWIFELEHIQLMLPIPDIYVYLDTKTDFCQENVLKKDRDYVDGLDVYEKSQELLMRCHNIYAELAGEIDELCVVECLDASGGLKSVEEIGAQVIKGLGNSDLYV